ncbi:hypothetical protein EVG20_g3739 [Dentipellis fragilis]|uniref:25S rRNA (uridine-N(3))-methyltransferase BMT5-like domain-containing protein n=1 Tax=Dentipellis fragilis TaxID=205917 RepID=A0A4Y9Z011_9AGAM|nr:hypothetical protein EVG20_g3739 [Dentipellis fragilis]
MAKGKKASLKTALSSQQARLKKKQEIKHAEQVAEQKGKKTKGKERAVPLRSTIPFGPTHRILLVGEGNFSFAHALIVSPPPTLEHLPPQSVYATAYDSEDECFSKYPDAEETVRVLREKGVHVLFSVDATALQKTTVLKGKTFDRIMWNFPHAGKGITDQDRNILSNQVLILGFLRSAAGYLETGSVPDTAPSRKKKRKVEDEDEDERKSDVEDFSAENMATRGTILITLRNVVPYTQWDLPRLAKNPPAPQSAHDAVNPRFTLLRSFVFLRSDWKGYEHRMTKGERAHGQGKTGEGGEDRTWEFCLKDIKETE